MKRRNLILGLIAIVFAVGSAAAYKTASVSTFVWSQAVSGGSFVLREITPQADGGSTATFDYQVKIVTATTPTGEIVFGRNASGVILKHTSATVANATLVNNTVPNDVANASNGQ